ncbi:transglycosylase domain-containing protein [Desmospora activa]|uniref:Penicillin-binding protein 1A/penicillin-binding protein 2A n=1 Tax=Desmospora activa DSM 45169 TaxID=1121389 RepID=A0A2T4Z0N5_9BACL|nr:transglycosylase domain-containing protein [Desmospora activa]PTM53314.1 penicillin-binding protein 1A/penicillin-binding protein 2A [Desmospora activa DSM 45169]
MNARKLKTFGRLFWKAMMTKKWWLLVVSTTLLVVVGGLAAVMLTTNVYELDSLKKLKFATTLYDRDEKEIEALGDTNREYIDLDDVKSQELMEAFVAIEDERFYEHNGPDLKGLARALAVDILTMSAAEGGSTITMQVARNIVLNEQREKTFMRKVTEIAIAYNLERKYTKKEILESYLNYISLGNEFRGIQTASKNYFDKDLTKDELEPHEIALLAGLPKAPEGYNPFKHEKNAIQRRNVVLAKMAEKEMITEQEKEKYQKMDLGVDPKNMAKHRKNENYHAYKDFLANEALERYGLDGQDLLNGGYKIYTGMNKKAQMSLERALRDDSYYQGHDNLDAGATIIDPKTGEIAAIGGGRNYLSGYENRALSRVQPGSAIKPLTVFAPVVEEKGYNENSYVSDSPYTYNGWSPQNYDGVFQGSIPLKQAAARSINAGTARLLVEVVGVETAFQYAEKEGLALEESDKQPAPLSLGGLSKGVSTLQVAQAYSLFPNGGKFSEAHSIVKIVAPDGTELEPKKELRQNEKVFSPRTADVMNQMLSYVVQSGTGGNARLADGRDVAGKTGTTQNNKEAWFVGYTPEYVMATMVFNEGGEHVRLSGGEYPARIFHKVMTDTLSGTEVSRFERFGGDGTTPTQPTDTPASPPADSQNNNLSEKEQEKQRKQEEKEAEKERKQQEKEQKKREEEERKRQEENADDGEPATPPPAQEPPQPGNGGDTGGNPGDGGDDNGNEGE